MGSQQLQKSVTLNLNIGDQLTSVSCGHIIVELIKFLVYQRLQIPYTYQWLKHLINHKKSRDDCDLKDSLQSQRHFRVASSALENLDFILKSLLNEINGPTLPDEVCITLGATPVTSKEVYRFLLPPVCHKLQCQSSIIAADTKIQRLVFDCFRPLIESEELSKVIFEPLPPTNMYMFVQKRVISNQELIVNTDNFTLSSGYRIPRTSKIVVIDFRKQNPDNIACCRTFSIFQDTSDNPTTSHVQNCQTSNAEEEGVCDIQSTDHMKWFQSTYTVKGFKDCVVNGSSITNLWLA